MTSLATANNFLILCRASLHVLSNNLQFLFHVKIIMLLRVGSWMTGIFIMFCFPRKDTSLHALIASDVKYNKPVQASHLCTASQNPQ